MNRIAYVAREQSRWLRQDSARWMRSDAARFLAPGADLLAAYPALARKYNPNQPRVPGGSGRESGQWTDGNSGGINDPSVISDGDPDSVLPGVQYAQVSDQNTRTNRSLIDLREEQSLGGHPIERRVGRSPEALQREVREYQEWTRQHGEFSERLG